MVHDDDDGSDVGGRSVCNVFIAGASPAPDPAHEPAPVPAPLAVVVVSRS